MSIVSRLFLVALVVSGPALAQHKAADPAAVSQRVAITGAVEQPLTLGVDELKAFPAGQVVELVRVREDENGRREDKLLGVRLRDLLARARIRAPGHHDTKKMVIVAGATDGYKVVYSWSEIFNSPVGEGVLVYFAKNGAPVPEAEGRIAMVSLQDLRGGPRHVKWLNSIEVRKVIE